jgi:PAS domain S-box-containing protein
MNITADLETQYRLLFENMLEGFAYCEMIFRDGKPEDFIYLMVNDSFEKLTGLSRVIGKRASEVIPGLRESNPELIEIYGRVSQTGVPEKFETYIDQLKNWFSISLYSPKPGYFSVVFDNITERKTIEKSLQDSEQRYRAVVDNVKIGISLLDSDLRIVSINRAMKEYYPNVQPGCGQVCYVQYNDPPRQSPCSYCPCVLTFQDGKVHRTVTETPAGSETKHYHLVSSPIKDSTGQVQYVVELVEDITEKKHAEERYRKLFEYAPLMYVITWNEGGMPYIADCNELFLSSVGFSKEEVIGQPLADFYSPESRLALLEGGGYSRALSGEFFMGERYLLRRDGSYTPTLLYTATEEDSRGKVIGTRAMFVDITSRKQAEEALKEKDKQYRSLFEDSIDGVYSTLRNGIITDANMSFCSLFGYSREELMGENITPLYRDPADRLKFQTEIEKKGFVKDYEIIFRKKDGTEVDCLLSSSVHLEKDDSIAGYRGIVRDLTARKELQRQLTQAQKMEAVGTLAGGIAHDFNNLLTVILGFSELLLINGDECDSFYKDVQKINKAARSGADLVKSMLTFSRKTDSNLRPTNINDKIEHVHALLSRTLPKMIEIRMTLDQNLSTVNSDPTQIEQILMNLSVNASDAIKDRGVLTIETRNVTLDEDYCKKHIGATPGDYVLLSVSDTGHGMDKETVKRIFEPFYTTKGKGRGTGLGLAMVYGIVKQHNGYIECHSELGQGSSFEIYFPAIQTAPSQETITEFPIFLGGNETVLLVDDEELVRDLAKRILERAGYTVLTAINGREALEVYKERGEEIAVIVLDLIMPVMGGKECFEELLKINPSVKVIISSGFSEDDYLKETTSMGINGMVNKPYTQDKLLDSVRAAINKK